MSFTHGIESIHSNIFVFLVEYLVASTVKHLPAMWEIWVRFLGWEYPLEKEMAIHSSTLAWKIPWTEEPDRLQSMGSQKSDTTELLHFVWQVLKPLCLEPWSAIREDSAIKSPHTEMKSSPGLPQLGKTHRQQQRPSAEKNKESKK